MGYPSPLGGVTQRLNPYTVIHSTKFTRGSNLKFGGRTAIITIPDTKKLVIWSSIPVSRELEKTIEEATDNEPGNFEVVAAIVPDTEHTLAASDLKKLYPKMHLIGPSGIKDKPDLKLDYEFTDQEANQVVEGSTISKDLATFQFVFLNGHTNRELVTLDKTTKTLYEADLLFNIPYDGKNHDQYPSENQNAGLAGKATRYLNPESKIGRFMFRKLLSKNEDTSKGLKAIYDLDFTSIVLSHGVNIDEDAKEKFHKVFSPLF
jgi:hypothetical protein